MNYAHLHLLLNHFPIIGTMIGTVILLAGFIRKIDALKTTAAYIIVCMTVLALPLPSTGEAAETAVENLPGVLETAIEAHEDAAELAMWLMGLAGLAALAALVAGYMKKPATGIIMIATLVFSVAAFAAMARTGYLGGKIRHTEISATTPATQLSPGETGADDDD